jgi:hypothetical protein
MSQSAKDAPNGCADDVTSKHNVNYTEHEICIDLYTSVTYRAHDCASKELLLTSQYSL